jgi:phosphoribosylaminoimidazole (AIR) synthetase
MSTYKDSGVDIDAGDRAVELMKDAYHLIERHFQLLMISFQIANVITHLTRHWSKTNLQSDKNA